MNPMLLHGDCLDVMKTLPDKSIDLFVCDLPYGCLTGGAGQEKSKRREKGDEGVIAGCAWDIKIDLDQFWVQVERLMKDDHTPILHFCNTRFGFELMKSKESWFRYDLVWEKTNAVGFLLANKMPMRSHENIYVFAKKGARYYRKDIEGDFPPSHYSNHVRSQTSNVVPRVKDLGTIQGSVYDCGSEARTNPIVRVPVREGVRCVRSVVKTSTKKGKGNHPTQKPAELYTWLLERYSKEGDTVLDPTAGSFTSVFTASELNRKAIGIEKDDDFYNKAVSNLSKT